MGEKVKTISISQVNSNSQPLCVRTAAFSAGQLSTTFGCVVRDIYYSQQ